MVHASIFVIIISSFAAKSSAFWYLLSPFLSLQMNGTYCRSYMKITWSTTSSNY